MKVKNSYVRLSAPFVVKLPKAFQLRATTESLTLRAGRGSETRRYS
jgi:hypothetical protein